MRKGDDSLVAAGTAERLVDLVLPPTSAPQLVLLSGPSGSGRTTVLRQAADRLERTVVWLDCSVLADRRPLQSLREALSSTGPQVFPTAMAAELAARLRDTATPDVDEVSALFWSVIGAGTGDLPPLVVVLDDVDLLDRASQQVAAYALRRLAQFGGVPVLLSAQHGAWAGGPVPTVDLEPLTTDDVRLLVERLVDAPVPYRVAESLRTVTGGNLLGVAAATDRLTAEQLSGRDLLPHPLPLGHAAARRLLRAAVVDHPGHLGLLAALAVDSVLSAGQARSLAGSPADLADTLTGGAVEQTPRGVRARTPVEALAAWELAPHGVRSEVHRVLADGADPQCAAVHRALVGPASADEGLVAAAACHRVGPAGHAALVLQAVDWSVTSAGVPLAHLLMADGYVASVRRIVDAPSARRAPLADELDGLRSGLAVLSGHLRDPLVDPPAAPPAGTDPAEWVRTVLGTVRSLIHRDDLGGARMLLDRTAEGIATTPPALRALARFVRAELGYQRREEWSLTELSRAAEDWLLSQDGDDPISISIMVFYLLAVGNPSLAGAILNRTEPPADTGSLVRVAHLVGRIQTEVVWGHHAAADHLIGAMDRAMPYSGAGAHTIGLVINVAAARGPDPERARIERRLDHPDVAGQPPEARSEVAAASGLRHLVEGAYGQALPLLDQALRSPSTLFTGATAVLASLLETNRALGATAEQNRQLRAGLGRWWPDRYGERFTGLEGRCDALCADADELDASFRTALERCGAGFPVDVARTHLAYGRCLQLAGRAGDADRQLERAAAIFANERLHGWIVHVERLRSAGAEDPAAADVAALTPTEREIVTLVLRRRTNADIARSLFMSKRTIELHLTRVFRKLRVSRKSELIELDSVRALLDRSGRP